MRMLTRRVTLLTAVICGLISATPAPAAGPPPFAAEGWLNGPDGLVMKPARREVWRDFLRA